MPIFKTVARASASAGDNGHDVAVEITVLRAEDLMPNLFAEIGTFGLHFLSSQSDAAIIAEIERRISEFVKAVDKDQLDVRSAAIAAAFDGKLHAP